MAWDGQHLQWILDVIQNYMTARLMVLNESGTYKCSHSIIAGYVTRQFSH